MMDLMSCLRGLSYQLVEMQCNVATRNSGRSLWWTRHPHVHLTAAAQPLFDPEESNPVDRKMRGRDALNLHGSGGQRFLLSQNIGL
ncbi:hypothetical protein TNCV_3999261 [Trichonephila clavipes]|nr:hypothetical protein TNCV_3999261 [Trichonephila clavipes]